mmetsp:Transcript_30925/g.51097  ORF Transcript_30925/g.51097 Transcript_30925/m.51097 type:complete len:224 (-) Transcript_30925:46-717(-)
MAVSPPKSTATHVPVPSLIAPPLKTTCKTFLSKSSFFFCNLRAGSSGERAFFFLTCCSCLAVATGALGRSNIGFCACTGTAGAGGFAAAAGLLSCSTTTSSMGVGSFPPCCCLGGVASTPSMVAAAGGVPPVILAKRRARISCSVNGFVSGVGCSVVSPTVSSLFSLFPSPAPRSAQLAISGRKPLIFSCIYQSTINCLYALLVGDLIERGVFFLRSNQAMIH